MNIPKTIEIYCKKCKKHTTHKLKQFKAGAIRTMSKGTRRFQRKHKSGYGGQAEFTIKYKKKTKKPTFICECVVCKQKIYRVIPKRMKKVELQA